MLTNKSIGTVFYFIICTTIALQSCTGKKTLKREVYNQDFNWTITIPENFDTVTAEQWARLQNKGRDAIEKTYDEKLDIRTKTIFVFKSDQLNYFESNYQPFDTAIDGNYLESVKNVNDMLYHTFESQIPGVKIDTATSAEIIDKLEFQTLKSKVTYPNNRVLNFFMFTRLFDDKQLSVNIMYVDKAKGELMLNAWRKSKFEHK